MCIRLTSTTILSVALAGIAQPLLAAGGMTASQIFQKSQQAYNAVHTFEQTAHSSVNGNNGGSAHIQFQRPGKLRVGGATMFNSNYDLLSNGTTWLYNAGNWETVKDAETGIGSITGISGSSGTAVPALLLHTRWGSPFPVSGNNNVTVGAENISGHSTYRISTTAPLATTFWIDKKTFFLVKMKQTFQTYTFIVTYNTPSVNKPIPAKAFTK